MTRTAVRLVAFAAITCALLASAPALADQDGTEAVADGEPAIGPGQEELLAEMLGKGATLPDACELTNGQTEYAVITATYTCDLGVVVVELVHPRQAEPTTTQTEHFAITVESGSPPESLTDALATLIRSRESEFEWTWNAPDAVSGEGDASNEEDDGALPGNPG
jgi:hypothetical protein